VRTGNFFEFDPRKTRSSKKQNRDIAIRKFSKVAIVESQNFHWQISNRLRFNALPGSSSNGATRVQSSRFTFCRFPMRSHKDAQGGLLHLNSAPNEATTSIWLKAMMVRNDLSRNTEFLENESGTGGGTRGARGAEPRGASRG
jgi:hypothetical protein